MGVAPQESGSINSIPPDPFGGNIDNWRNGFGETLHYPVFNRGANLYVSDTHMVQGNAKLSGMALEASMNAYLQIFVNKDFAITNPIMKTETHWIIHGFNEDLNKAIRQLADQMLRFLQRSLSAGVCFCQSSVQHFSETHDSDPCSSCSQAAYLAH